MRLAYTLTAALLTGISATSVCTQYPYAYFAPLARVAAAEQFCSSRFPVATVQVTVTAKATTIPTIVAVRTISTTTANTTTPRTVTTSTITSTTRTFVQVASFTNTTTTIAPFTVLQKRAPTTLSTSAKTTSTLTLTKSSTTSSVAPNVLLASLQSSSASFISTVCSCIEIPLTTTVITTPTVYTNLTSTAYVNLIATVTSSLTALATLKLVATTTTSTTRTVTETDRPSCPTVTAVSVDDHSFAIFYIGAGYTTNPTDSSGNDEDYIPYINALDGTLSACVAIQQCINLADTAAHAWAWGIDLHYLQSSQQWICVQYIDTIQTLDFKVTNTDVTVAYGYNIAQSH